MPSFLNITRQPYEEPYHLHLLVFAGNPTTLTRFEIYTTSSDLNDAAESLIGFPKSNADTFTWQLGSELEQDRFAFYFRVRVFQFSHTGRCAIEIRFSNNRKPPHQQIVEFCIEVDPSDVDRLSRMLKSFARMEDLTMEWSVPLGT